MITVWNNRGLAQYDLEQYSEALASYDKAIAIEHGLYRCVEQSWKRINDYLGQYTEAVASYDKAIAIDPNEAIMWNNRGNALRGARSEFRSLHLF